jgi:hypothetical protein
MGDHVEEDRPLAQLQAIFDRGLPAEDRETVVAFLTELLVKGLGAETLGSAVDEERLQPTAREWRRKKD